MSQESKSMTHVPDKSKFNVSKKNFIGPNILVIKVKYIWNLTHIIIIAISTFFVTIFYVAKKMEVVSIEG